MPMDRGLIEYKLEHEYMVSKVVDKLNGEVLVNKSVEIDSGNIILMGKIDILLMNEIPVIIEVKSGKEKVSHHTFSKIRTSFFPLYVSSYHSSLLSLF